MVSVATWSTRVVHFINTERMSLADTGARKEGETQQWGILQTVIKL
jgi:hypothetical protein